MRIKIIFVVVLFVSIVSQTVYADTQNVSALVFTTVPESIKQGEISKEIVVQAQNSSGTAEPVSETNDVTFTSSSPTGLFLNSSGNTVTKTMSKNTSSRTFYYKDSAQGEVTLEVAIKGRETGKTFTATQKISIASLTGGGVSTTTATTTDVVIVNNNATTTNTSNESGGYALSAHSSTYSVTYVYEPLQLKVDAGRKRITTSKTSVEFEALAIGDGSENVSYLWSFGDGSTEKGKKVTHKYLYSGDYNVVLNVHGWKSDAVSRTSVKVVDPEIYITHVELGEYPYIEIRNDSRYEVNIQDWILHSENGDYIFPRDTIISGMSSVKFPINLGSSLVTLGMGRDSNKQEEVATIPDLSFKEPTVEDIERAKHIVAEQFREEDVATIATNSLQSEDNTKSATDIIEYSESNTSSTSIIDSALKNQDDNFGASPFRFFYFIKNFFTK